MDDPLQKAARRHRLKDLDCLRMFDTSKVVDPDVFLRDLRRERPYLFGPIQELDSATYQALRAAVIRGRPPVPAVPAPWSGETSTTAAMRAPVGVGERMTEITLESGAKYFPNADGTVTVKSEDIEAAKKRGWEEITQTPSTPSALSLSPAEYAAARAKAIRG